MSISKYYKIVDGKLVRLKKFCPRCGPGVFMAEHWRRYTCGKCGYTEYVRETTKEKKKEGKEREDEGE